MNGIDENHLNMRWNNADTVKGVDGNKVGALAVMYYLAGESLSGKNDRVSELCSMTDAETSGSMHTPLDSDKPWVTSGFDFRIRSNGIRRNHNGIDLVGGTQIVAAMDGTVTLARYYGGYGYAVIIDHGGGIETLYAHMKEGSLSVDKGQSVKAGDSLGIMGNTGDSEGNHLHFEYHKDGVPQNPFPILEEHGVDLTWRANAYPKNEKPGPQD
jgi:murein DD-endopeptidase MepM/ murein hydrolase activator NlpD